MMSTERKVIELKAPAWNSTSETIVSTGHKCEYCQGNGWFWKNAFGDPDPEKEPCPVCHGKGELDAVITIQWKPTSKE